jgi:hypothetical protein
LICFIWSLSLSHDLDCKFDMLTRVDSRCLFFFFFLIEFFFRFILQHWFNWELSFIFGFDLLSIGLSWSYDPDHGFCRLTWVDPLCFCLNIFLKKHVFFDLFLVKLIFKWFFELSLESSSWPGHIRPALIQFKFIYNRKHVSNT